MIIDADCHISSHKFDELAITADELIAQMDRNGVDKAVIWLKPPYNKNIDPENRAIYDAVQRYPDRLLGFGWANPQLGHDHARDTIKQCFEDYGLRGLKFNGAQDYYVIDDPQTMPLIEYAASFGKPLAFHIGADFYENTHPYRLGHIASLLPDTHFIMIHMGGARLPALTRSAIETAQQYANITLIGSAVPYKAILQAIQALGSDRVCFGSDTPFRLMHVCLAAYRALMRDLPADDQANVLGGNIARLLDLEAQPAP
jgi:predicted TIM-barrel fold metal-dependent hydrolase